MAIVRSLLIKIGFVNDRAAQSQADKAISTFKRKALLAASAITYAFTRVASYFSDFANKILDTDEFSKHIGVAIEQLYAMQKAAEKVARIEEKDFQTAITNIQKMFVDLKTNSNYELQEIADALGFKVDRINDNGASLFQKILNGLANVRAESERSRIAENIFKGVDYRKFASLASNMDKFAEATKEFAKSGQEIKESLQSFKDYADSIRELTQAWEAFVVTISKNVIPVLRELIDPLKQVFDLVRFSGNFWKTIFKGDLEGFKSNLKVGSKLLDPAFETVGNAATGTTKFIGDALSGFFGPWFKSINDYVENREGYQYNPVPTMGGSPQVTVNNEISVSPGTTSEQAQYMADQISQVVEESINTTFRQIQYNNPVVE